MAKSTTARYETKIITIDEALALRGRAPSNGLIFHCIQCGERVRPHKEGGGASAHFEHLARNKLCSLSDI
jgi:5-methylcytosine-specific restriction enzyme A